MNTVIIGVAGGTGSGKTTLAKKLLNEFKDNAVVISHDYYYKNNTHLSYEERAKQNYDHPNALDTDLLISHLKELKEGRAVDIPTYNFETHLRNPDTKRIESKPIIIVEGILIFESEELRNLFDIKLFVDTTADVRFIRRLQRDVKYRGRTIESVVNQYLNTVQPMHNQFVEPYKKYADIIIPEGGDNKVALNVLLDGIKKDIKKLEK